MKLIWEIAYRVIKNLIELFRVRSGKLCEGGDNKARRNRKWERIQRIIIDKLKWKVMLMEMEMVMLMRVKVKINE